jgi:hypothetical protein
MKKCADRTWAEISHCQGSTLEEPDKVCERPATHYRRYSTGSGLVFCEEHKPKDAVLLIHAKECSYWPEGDNQACCGKPAEHEASELIYDTFGLEPAFDGGIGYLYLCDEHWKEMQKKRPESF